MAVRSGQKLVTNWWTKDTDMIDPEIYNRIDHNARRRIYTQIEKGKIYGNETDEVNGVRYECHWRIVNRKKKQDENV